MSLDRTNENDWTLFALPGFLGIPQDWNFLFPQHPSIKSLDIFSSFSIEGLWEWAECFNAWVQQKSSNSPRALIGYSLGGRLALHAVLQNPNLWHGAIIISAHPGLKNPTEKEERLALDHHWAQRFEKEPWEPLMRDWNARTVFEKDPFIFKRQEKDYSRNSLACALRKWSLGIQDNLLLELQHLNMPLLWLTGADDSHYSSLANQIVLKHPFSNVLNIPKAGHRVPWQQPEIFHEQLNQFLKGTLCKH